MGQFQKDRRCAQKNDRHKDTCPAVQLDYLFSTQLRGGNMDNEEVRASTAGHYITSNGKAHPRQPDSVIETETWTAGQQSNSKMPQKTHYNESSDGLDT